MKKLILVLSILFCLFSCQSKKDTASTSSTNVQIDSEKLEYEFWNVSENDSLFASINKGMCFGQCPAYSMKIYNNGLVNYNGKSFVDKEGSYSMRIEKEQMLLFVEKAKEIKYMEMDNLYDNKNITDLPSISSSIVINKTRKSINRRFGYPREILEFEQLFDDLLSSDKWIKNEDSQKKIQTSKSLNNVKNKSTY